mgnify:CR=1 FL=1
MIEHLPNDKYQEGLKELQRISKKYILISVPKKEKLKDNFIKCPYCMSEFNSNFHKRSFTETSLVNLFPESKWKCLFVKSIGIRNKYFLLSGLYSFFKKNFKKDRHEFFSICPFCGFQKENTPRVINQKRQTYNSFSNFIKSVWPKSHKAVWLLALYEKR